MLDLFKSIFGGKKSEEEIKVSKFKKYAEKEGYTWVGYFPTNNKISIKDDTIGIVINITTGDVVTTKGTRKFKRYGLDEKEIKDVISNPNIRIEGKRFQIIDK